ncbi:hypothetical protein SAMN06313486_10187 [Epsilonproteobacteria bacterium SCGC AD-308-P11]|jgi:hypothetical protein|nr:hypothetical protein SAMN06313486_10187 [Epsilonproteobacteria bacterium SCGC AD-308-P11]
MSTPMPLNSLRRLIMKTTINLKTVKDATVTADILADMMLSGVIVNVHLGNSKKRGK